MSTMVAAVGTDTYGGLSGYKRPTAGNPTRVPSNLPAFRGTANKPGSNIRAPAIKSSANHPDRKTNIQIPYARVVPVEFPASLGRLGPGDVAFVSKTRPGLPGYACAYQSRLIGVDALNKFMGPDFWSTTIEVGSAYRYILVDSKKPADDWRNVPSLQEWTLDGVVLSNEERELFYNASDGKRENQLYNIAIQGPTMLNNGYVEEAQNWDEVARMQQGQIAREQQTFSGSYMDHRVEKFGPNTEVEIDQKWDFKANYQGPQYHLYPLQMFDRGIRPMNKLYVGLVCSEYRFDGAGNALGLIKQAADAQAAIKDLEKTIAKYTTKITQAGVRLTIANDNLQEVESAKDALSKATQAYTQANTKVPPLPQAKMKEFRAAMDAAQAALDAMNEAANVATAASAAQTIAKRQVDVVKGKSNLNQLHDNLKLLIATTDGLANAVRAKTAWAKMGWWSGGDRKPAGTDGAPKDSFCAFRYVLFTSAQLDEINLATDNNPNGIAMQTIHPGEPVLRTKRQRLGKDPFDDDTQRRDDFRHMVGAWHVGSVLDMKAGKMPWFEGGPADTGFRVTANVNVRWCDWRDLRRTYTPSGSPVQVGDALTGSERWNAGPDAAYADRNAIVQWPSRWVTDPKLTQEQRDEANAPFDPNPFYNGKEWRPSSQAQRRAPGPPKSAAEEAAAAQAEADRDAALTEAQRQADAVLVDDPNNPDGPSGPQIPVAIESAIRKARLARLAVYTPPAQGAKVHFTKHVERAGTALNNLALLLAPITREEIAAHRGNTALPPVAQYVMANPPAAPVSAATAATASVASGSGASGASGASAASSAAAPSLRRRTGGTPEPSPDRVGVVTGASAATGASGSGLAPVAEASGSADSAVAPMVIEAPAAPGASAPESAAPAGGRKRRTGGTDDVFSTIFGGSSTDAPMQPLNPQHRSDAGGGSTGRSYQRRSKGSGSGGKS